MAETITQITQPAPFIEAAAKPFITQLQQAVGGFFYLIKLETEQLYKHNCYNKVLVKHKI